MANNLAHLALRIQNILVYGARNASISVKLLRAGKRAVQSHIVNHVKDRLRKRTRRSNVIIQLNPANPVGGGGGVHWISTDRDARRIGKYFFG